MSNTKANQKHSNICVKRETMKEGGTNPTHKSISHHKDLNAICLCKPQQTHKPEQQGARSVLSKKMVC